jgi:hypothetical protein
MADSFALANACGFRADGPTHRERRGRRIRAERVVGVVLGVEAENRAAGLPSRAPPDSDAAVRGARDVPTAGEWPRAGDDCGLGHSRNYAVQTLSYSRFLFIYLNILPERWMQCVDNWVVARKILIFGGASPPRSR